MECLNCFKGDERGEACSFAVAVAIRHVLVPMVTFGGHCLEAASPENPYKVSHMCHTHRRVNTPHPPTNPHLFFSRTWTTQSLNATHCERLEDASCSFTEDVLMSVLQSWLTLMLSSWKGKMCRGVFKAPFVLMV